MAVLAAMEVVCLLRFDGTFGTLEAAVVMTRYAKRSRAGRGKSASAALIKGVL